MTGPVALKAAYIVTWVVLLGYLGSLLRRFRRVREEMRDKISYNAATSQGIASPPMTQRAVSQPKSYFDRSAPRLKRTMRTTVATKSVP